MSLYGILRKTVAVGTGLNIYINQGGNECQLMLACTPQAVYPAAWPSAMMQDGVLSQEDVSINKLPDRWTVRDKDDGPRLVLRAQPVQQNLSLAPLHIMQGSLEDQQRQPRDDRPGHFKQEREDRATDAEK